MTRKSKENYYLVGVEVYGRFCLRRKQLLDVQEDDNKFRYKHRYRQGR